MIEQLVQVFGSLLILAAFVAAQRGALATTSRSYLLLNLVGSAILAVLAAYAHQWGFLLLEGVWALVSARALAQHCRSAESGGRSGRRAAATRPTNVANGDVVVLRSAADAHEHGEPAPAEEFVLTVPCPEALTREPDEAVRVLGRRDEPLLVVVASYPRACPISEADVGASRPSPPASRGGRRRAACAIA